MGPAQPFIPILRSPESAIIPALMSPNILQRGARQGIHVRLSVRKAAYNSVAPPSSTGNPGPSARVQDGSTSTLNLKHASAFLDADFIRRKTQWTEHPHLSCAFCHFGGITSHGTGRPGSAGAAVLLRYNLAGIREQSNWQRRLGLPMPGAGPPKAWPVFILFAHCATTRAWSGWKT